MDGRQVIQLSMEGDKLRIDAGPIATSRLRTLQGIRSHPRSDPPYWTVTPTYLHAKILRKMFGKDIEMTDEVRKFFSEKKSLWAVRVDPLPVYREVIDAATKEHLHNASL